MSYFFYNSNIIRNNVLLTLNNIFEFQRLWEEKIYTFFENIDILEINTQFPCINEIKSSKNEIYDELNLKELNKAQINKIKIYAMKMKCSSEKEFTNIAVSWINKNSSNFRKKWEKTLKNSRI